MIADGPTLVTVTRTDQRSGRERPESAHRGHVVVVDGDGIVGALGEPDVAVFVRSAAKPFQATGVLEILTEHGGPELGDEAVAVGWSSHRGEPPQLEVVLDLLAAGELDPDALTCPPATPAAAPGAGETRLHHNCSGKHALFALAGRALGAEREQLLDPDGPVQRRVLSVLADALGPPQAIAIDGCGAPAVAVPLHRLADGFRRLETEPRWERVRRAGLTHPGLIGGEGRLETALLAAGVVAKNGAEGIFAASWTASGRTLGLAVKCADGDHRGSTAAVASVLVSAGVLDEEAWRSEPPLGGGEPAGTIETAPELAELGRSLSV